MSIVLAGRDVGDGRREQIRARLPHEARALAGGARLAIDSLGLLTLVNLAFDDALADLHQQVDRRPRRRRAAARRRPRRSSCRSCESAGRRARARRRRPPRCARRSGAAPRPRSCRRQLETATSARRARSETPPRGRPAPSASRRAAAPRRARAARRVQVSSSSHSCGESAFRHRTLSLRIERLPDSLSGSH